jgi:hypothetical protein
MTLILVLIFAAESARTGALEIRTVSSELKNELTFAVSDTTSPPERPLGGSRMYRLVLFWRIFKGSRFR